MRFEKIPAGLTPPWEVNVIIEVPLQSPVKYEIDKESGAVFVDRFMHTSMAYPTNYGFIPHTLAEDGDAVDALVVGSLPLVPGCVVRARPIGVLIMEDEAGMDEKLLCVPVDQLHPTHTSIASYRELPQILLDTIAHFFEHYKDLEPNKWVKVVRWGEAGEACRLIEEGIERAAEEAKAKGESIPMIRAAE